jgi:hypothetical protein
MKWPRADAIVGNPPFHGSLQMRRVLGDDYIEWLKKEFGIGVKDYCVYWFRKAHARLEDGGRAGLVGTNSISQNRARSESLEHILGDGGVITNAVSTQDWPGDAAVDVSIVNWLKSDVHPSLAMLDGAQVSEINASLRGTRSMEAVRLAANRRRSFQGPQPVGKGFLLDRTEAEALLALSDAPYRDVVRPYLVGEDIANAPDQRPTRYVIDFGLRPLQEAMQFPVALEIVRERVKPERDRNRRKVRREKWWLLGELVPSMRRALGPLDRYLAGTATGKRVLFTWCDPWTCPSNATNVFAFESDSAFGVLTSALHTDWARRQSSTLEDRIRYTPTSAFETFPWPSGDLNAVADVSRRLYARRSEICLERNIGLTKLYNQVDDGAWSDLRELHRELDEAVALAYGWPASVAHDSEERNRRLLELNRAIAAGEVDYRPFGAGA